jgi:hypothetical protein
VGPSPDGVWLGEGVLSPLGTELPFDGAMPLSIEDDPNEPIRGEEEVEDELAGA